MARVDQSLFWLRFMGGQWLNKNSLELKMAQSMSSNAARRSFSPASASTFKIFRFSALVGGRDNADKKASSIIFSGGSLLAIHFAITLSFASSFLLMVLPLARCSTCDTLGSAVRSHSQVFSRSGRPK